MKILFLTNFYPPASRGGYEQWCQEIADDLHSRGHQIVVLTSRSQADDRAPDEPDWIRRELHLEMPLVSLRNGIEFFTRRKHREAENLALLSQLLEDERPDALLVWGLWNLSRSLPALAEARLPGRVVYYMGDYWPTLPTQYEEYWRAPARNWATALPKAILKVAAQQVLSKKEIPSLQLAHVLFPTRFMCNDFQRRGISLRETAIIYGAVDVQPYLTCRRQSSRANGHLSLLYAGRLAHEKGVHTAIEAMGTLVKEHAMQNVHLTIAGGGDPGYVAYLQQVIRQQKVDAYITLLGSQPPAAMPRLYSEADVLLFTSIWDEPFGRVLVEAMASGLVVIGTATGGAGEILVENENALLFAPGDGLALADKVVCLARSPELRQQLSECGRRVALEKFDVRRMAAEIEAYLQRL